MQGGSNQPKKCFGRSWEGSQDNSSQYLRSSCCLLVWHLTVWWFLWKSYFHRGMPPYHFNPTTRTLIHLHKVVPKTGLRINPHSADGGYIGEGVNRLIWYQSHCNWTTGYFGRTWRSCIGIHPYMASSTGPFLEQVADWSKGSVHVTWGLLLVVSIEVACDQGLISTCILRRS